MNCLIIDCFEGINLTFFSVEIHINLHYKLTQEPHKLVEPTHVNFTLNLTAELTHRNPDAILVPWVLNGRRAQVDDAVKEHELAFVLGAVIFLDYPRHYITL